MYLSHLRFQSALTSTIQLQHRQERLLRHLNGSNLAHTFLAFLLFFKQFALSRHVAAVAFGRHVLAHLAHGFAGNDFGANGGLNGHVELLARNQLL